jgi:hypothetical protein
MIKTILKIIVGVLFFPLGIFWLLGWLFKSSTKKGYKKAMLEVREIEKKEEEKERKRQEKVARIEKRKAEKKVRKQEKKARKLH